MVASSTAVQECFVTHAATCARVLSEGPSMLQPCDPDATMWLLRHALDANPEDVDLELVFELVAQLVTDLRAWPFEP